jgi:hypothetical protein
MDRLKKALPKPKPKLTDAERHKRFVETAKKVEASEKIEDFDLAFANLIKRKAKAAERDS